MKMLLGALALTAAVAAPSLTGSWTMKVEGSPHGDATMAMTLKQDGTRVTGTFVSGHGPDLALDGEFVDGALKLATTGDDNHRITFSAKLKEDGTLKGFLSSAVGDMTWTAKRFEAKEGKDLQ